MNYNEVLARVNLSQDLRLLRAQTQQQRERPTIRAEFGIRGARNAETGLREYNTLSGTTRQVREIGLPQANPEDNAAVIVEVNGGYDYSDRG